MCLPSLVLAACAGDGSAWSNNPQSCPGSDASSAPGAELLRVDFEARSPGPYTMGMMGEDFGESESWNNGLDEGRAVVVEDADGHHLHVAFPAGKFGPQDGGVQFMVRLPESQDELFLAYRLRFAGDFQFVKGGKLPGLVGGSAPTGCGLDPEVVASGFSARMMWRTGGVAVQLMYTSTMIDTCGDDFPYAACGAGVRFSPGAWHRVVHRMRMNTPGLPDGIAEAWLDGSLALARHDVAFRGQGHDFRIDGLYFSTFFGGGDASWAPAADQAIDFDDFVVSTGMP
jgi:hypothetical protein